MGGVFSEGIDLKKERLIGAVIVGTGLPMVCVEQEVLRGYFEEKEEAGFDFAYQYPGMNKVLQAAGRVIRTTEDEGIILLLDDRFLKKRISGTVPKGMGAFPDGKQKERWSVPFGLLGVTGQVDGYPGSRLPGRCRKCAGLVKGCCRSYTYP